MLIVKIIDSRKVSTFGTSISNEGAVETINVRDESEILDLVSSRINVLTNGGKFQNNYYAKVYFKSELYPNKFETYLYNVH
jgi:hypothetical protein